MASAIFVLRGLLFALIFLLRPAISSSIPLAEIERLLTEPEDETLVSSLTRPGPSNVDSGRVQNFNHPATRSSGAVLTQPINLDGSWLDILRRQPSQTLDEYLNADSQTEQQDKQFLLDIGAPVYTMQDRWNKLEQVRDRFYHDMVAKTLQSNYHVLPYQGHLTRSEFRTYVEEVSSSFVNKRGMWPLEIDTPFGKEQYLLNKVIPISPVFESIHRFRAASRSQLYLVAWQEVRKEGSTGIYEHLGAFKTPSIGKLLPYKNRALHPKAIEVLQPRALSGSTFIARLRHQANAVSEGTSS